MVARPLTAGYIRIALATLAFFQMAHAPGAFYVLYSVSCVLDALDGYLARLLGQSSVFGAVLDMLVDRCTTSGLLAHLSHMYAVEDVSAPTELQNVPLKVLFILLICLDLSSHYAHAVCSLMNGHSHKSLRKRGR